MAERLDGEKVAKMAALKVDERAGSSVEWRASTMVDAMAAAMVGHLAEHLDVPRAAMMVDELDAQWADVWADG